MKRFLEQKTLGPYFERYFEESQLQPVKYDGPNGKITGYKATILTSICKMMLEARRDGVTNLFVHTVMHKSQVQPPEIGIIVTGVILLFL